MGEGISQMDANQYYNRKQYIEQVRNSFSDTGEHRNISSRGDHGIEDREIRSFFKIRLALGILLFLGFLFVQQADLSYGALNAPNIVKQVKRTVSFPDSLEKLKEAVHTE